MAKFRVGDRVRVLAMSGLRVQTGDEGTVLEDDEKPWIRFDRQIHSENPFTNPGYSRPAGWDPLHMGAINEEQLELIEEDTPLKTSAYRFRKGDRVRVIEVDPEDDFEEGDFGTVDEDGSTAPWVLFDDGCTFAARQDQLELVSRAKKPAPESQARLTLVQATKQLCERYGTTFDANNCLGTLEALIEAARNHYELKMPESQAQPITGAW